MKLKNKRFMNVIFSLRKSKQDNQVGTIQYYVSFNGQRSVPKTTKVKLPIKDWNGQRVSGRNAASYNLVLEDIRADLMTLYHHHKEKIIHIQEISDMYEGKLKPQITLVELYDKLIESKQKAVTEGTLNIYIDFKENWLIPYLKNIKDEHLEARCFTYKNMEGLKTFMLDSGKINSMEYLEKSLLRLKAAIRLGYAMELIEKDAVAHYKLGIKKEKGTYNYLTPEELKRFAKLKFTKREKHLEQARDLFLVQCYTSLSYGELKDFDVKKHFTSEGNWEWILQQRGKTNETHYIPLLDEALELLRKLKFETNPTVNHKYNENIRTCMYRANIDKYIRSHFGKHTCGAFLLNSGVRLDVVSKVLGHKSIRTTERIYAKMIHTWGVLDEFNRVFRSQDKK